MFTMKIVLNDILLICAIVKVSATQASTNTQAGYTKDSDTCKQYNENLQKMWVTLSKYINSKDPLNEQALHNIAIIVEAYLDHQNKQKEEEVVFPPDDMMKAARKNDNISGVLKNIKKLLGTPDAITKIKEMVLVNIKPTYEEQDPGCKQINEDNLFSSIALSYKNYLDKVECRGDDDPEFLRRKAQLRTGQQPDSQLISRQRVHDFYDDVDEGIIDEAESTNQFHGDMIPVIKYPRSLDTFNQRTNTRRSSQEYSVVKRVFRRLASSSSPSTLGDKSKAAVRTNTLSQSKINARTNDFCIKYANRIFLKTLRTIIERFNNLRDCMHDDTLRTSNKETKKPRGFQYTRPMLRVSDNDIQLMANIRPGLQERIRINNYNNKLNSRPLYISPLLLQNRNRLRNLNLPLPYYSSQNNKQQIKYPFNYIVPVGYNFDNNHIAPAGYNFNNNHKSFLYSPDSTSQTTTQILKTQCASNGFNNENNIQNNENSQNAKASINRQGQNSSHSDPTVSEPLNTNNVISKNLLQDTVDVNFNTVTKVLTELQNSSLQNTQLDMNNIALNNEKGHVELSYLVKYPKSLVYRPQYLVKNILSYDDFIKAASHLYINDEEKELLKILRFLPDNSTRVLFENREINSPLAIHDIINEINKSSLIERTNDNINNENHAHSILKLIEKDKTSSVTGDADSRREDEIIVTVNPVPLQQYKKDKVETNFKQGGFNLQDKINSDTYSASPLVKNKMNIHVNPTDFLQEDTIETDLKDFHFKDESNSDTYPISPFREDKMIVNVIPADYLQEDKAETDLKQEDFDLQDEINSGRYPASLFRRNKMTFDPNLADFWLEDKVETDLEETNFKLQDRVNSDTDLASPLRKDEMTTNINRADSLQKEIVETNLKSRKQADFNLQDEVISDTHIASPFRRNDITINVNSAESLQEDKVKTGEQQANLTRNYKTDIDIDSVDHLREDKIIINVNPTDSLQVDKDINYIEQVDSAMKRDFETDIDHAESLKQNKMTTNVNPANYLQKDKFELDDELAVLPQNGKNVNEKDHTGFLRDDNLSTNINSADSLIKDKVQTDIEQAHSIPKDFYLHSKFQKFNNDINQAGSLAEDKIIKNINTTHSSQKAKVETDVQGYSTRTDKIGSDIGHAESLRQNKMFANFNSTDSLEEYEVKPNIVQTYSIRRDQFETDVDHREPLKQNNKKSSFMPLFTLKNEKDEIYLDQTDSIGKDFINSDTAYAEALGDVEIVTSIYPKDALHRDKIQIDAVQAESSIKNKIDIKDKAAAFLADFQKAYKNDNDVYNTDPLIDDKNKAVAHDLYFRTEDETVTSRTQNQIEIKRSEISSDVNNVRPLQKRISTKFNFDSLSGTNEKATSMGYDLNTAKTTLNTASEAYMQLETYKAESAALTLRSWWDKWKDKLNSTFQVKTNNQLVKTLEISKNT